MSPNPSLKRPLTTIGIFSVVAGALILSGCTGMTVTNTGNSGCEFRLQSDRERCLQNTESNKRALEERRKANRQNDTESP